MEHCFSVILSVSVCVCVHSMSHPACLWLDGSLWVREEKESLWGPSVNLSSAPFTHSSACSVMRETEEVSEISFITKRESSFIHAAQSCCASERKDRGGESWCEGEAGSLATDWESVRVSRMGLYSAWLEWSRLDSRLNRTSQSPTVVSWICAAGFPLNDLTTERTRHKDSFQTVLKPDVISSSPFTEIFS